MDRRAIEHYFSSAVYITIYSVALTFASINRRPKYNFSAVLFVLMAVFILQTYNASGRLWARHFSASFCSSFNSSRIKTGERRITRLDELNRLV